MIFNEIQRFYYIIRIILYYGLDDFIPKTKLTISLIWIRKLLFWIPNKYPNIALGKRLRWALQELGPIWIKFGQMLSTRYDLLPSIIIDQLIILQDRVPSFNGIVMRQYIEQIMGYSLDTWLYNFQQKPLASASIAQIYAACLKKNNKEIIIKVIKPNILPIIQADIHLMYRLAYLIPKFLPDIKRLRPVEVVAEYEKYLLDELNLLHETSNAIQLRKNFKNSSILYIPEVYPEYCSKNIMVMERIYGISINAISELEKSGTNMKLLAERGVQIFFTQVFRDSFFHGDMHPGNIFVSYEHLENPKYVGVDFGIVGSLNKKDKHYLAGNFMAFFNRDYRKVAELHLDSGWIPQNTNLEDFEASIRTVCEPIFKKPLTDISFGHILINLFNTARRFNMEIQPQLILLQKTLLYVEGIGKQLYPQLDLWKTAKPFLENWIRNQISIFSFLKLFKEKMPYWIEKLPELPDLIYENIHQNKLLKDNVNRLTIELNIKKIRYEQAYLSFSLGTILIFIGIILLLQDLRILFLPFWFIFAGIYSWFISWKKIYNKN